MKCSKCGKEIAEDSNFCEFCGVPIEKDNMRLNFGKRLLYIVTKHKIISYICAALLAVILFFFFVVDNPQAHHSEIKFNGWIFYEGDDILLSFSPKFHANETPYHYNTSWQRILITYNDELGEHLYIYDGEFRPRRKSDIGRKVIENWCFVFHDDDARVRGGTPFKFEPGVHYYAEIFGCHSGVIFNRSSRVIRLEFVYPQEPSEYDYFQVECDIINSPNIQPDQGSGYGGFIVLVAFTISLTLFLIIRHKRKTHQ